MYCGNYETPRFKDIYENYTTFNAAMTTSGIPLKITNESLQTLYYLLYARYGLSHIATSDTSQFAYKVASTIFMYGPTWEKRLEIQDTIRSWTEEDLLNGALQINNLSTNPAQEPATTSFEILPYTNQQTATKYKKSKLDGYSYLMSLLETDVTEEFIGQFAKYFMTFVGWPHNEEEEEDLGTQTKTVTPTKSTQYVQADEGYVLDTVVVNPIPNEYIIPAGTLNITQNNEYNVASYQRVSVNVESTTPEPSDFSATFESLIQYSSGNMNTRYGLTVGGNALAVFVDGSIMPTSNLTFNDIAPSNPTLYLPSGETRLTLSGTAYDITTGMTEELSNTPVAWIVNYSYNGEPAIAYSEIQAPQVGPSGIWAIGSDFNGQTIAYNPSFYEALNSIYNTFYPDATEPCIIKVNFENNHSIEINESMGGYATVITIKDASNQVLATIADRTTTTTNTYTFYGNFVISSITYEGISYGTDFGETEFWNKMTQVLNGMLYLQT